MKLLLSTVKTECFDSKLALKNMYNVVGNAPLEVTFKEFESCEPAQRIYEELLDEKYSILYFHADEINESKIAHICEMIKKAIPSCITIVGGKEVSFETREFMLAHPEVDYVFRGEGEKVLFDFVRSIITYDFDFASINGLAYRENDEILVNKIGEPIRYDDIPFTYDKFEVKEGDDVCYESSRGVPDTCHYSQYMPGVSLRSLSLNRICNELRYFLVKKVGKVEFVEKWFNYDVSRAYRIWEYLINNDNGITTFTFDVNGDLLDEETVELLSEARAGLFQFNVDIESTNAIALAASGRKENIYQLMYNVSKLLQNRKVNVRVIQRVGLPGETIELFERSFNKIYNLGADEFDIKVIRIKKGTMFRQRADEFGYVYSREYPNEVITNDYISAANIVRIKLIAETVKTFEHGFEDSIAKILFDAGLKPFDFFDGLTSFIMENDLSCKLGKEENLYRIIYTYAAELYDKNEDTLKLQVLQEVLHSDMNKNVSQDVIRRLERKGWEIHVKAKAKQDRIAKYLQELNGGILFDELSDKYLKDAGVLEILQGVPVPIAAGVGDEITTLTIAFWMARVIGADTNFEYKDNYIAYIKHLFGDDAAKALIAEGAKYGQSGNYEFAAMFFRAVLLFEPKSQDALYLYGRACKDAYELENEDESYVGNFKAESLEIFELLTRLHPEFAMGYYFLGYGYVNMGLYTKANLTWKKFIELTAATGDLETEELRSEISERMDALEEPVKIEEGVNCVLSGDYLGGLEILSRYKDGSYHDWWPLWYYMAVCSASMGDAEPAIEYYKQALVYTPSNIDIMEELASVYAAIGDQVNAAKYLNKIEIVKSNIEQEES